MLFFLCKIYILSDIHKFEFHPHYECVSPVLDFPETKPPSQTTDYLTAVLMGYLVVKETWVKTHAYRKRGTIPVSCNIEIEEKGLSYY